MNDVTHDDYIISMYIQGHWAIHGVYKVPASSFPLCVSDCISDGK